MPQSTEDTVDLMIRELKARGIEISSREEAALVLMQARFRTREITQHLDEAMAGARVVGRIKT